MHGHAHVHCHTLALLMAAACLLAPPARADEGAPAFEHVIVVVMENHSYAESSALPYTAALIAVSASFANSHAVTHPSLPNYLALWGGSTMDVTNDNCPAPGSPFSTANLGQSCEAAGITWKAYSESLPAPGSTVCSASHGAYTRKHDPWTYWNNVTHANEVPFGQFALDTAAHALPALAFVVPDNCHNTHDCPASVGDAWLAAHLPGMIDAVGPNGHVVLTWDEDDYAGDNQILTVFAGPLVRPGYVSARALNHYSVVRTLCAGLGIDAFGAALTDSSVTDAWLGTPTGTEPVRPRALWLDAPAPSPARGATSTVLHLPLPLRVDAAILDVSGRRLRTLDAGVRSGSFTLRWDGRDDAGRDAGSGVFFLRVRAGGEVLGRTVVRVK